MTESPGALKSTELAGKSYILDNGRTVVVTRIPWTPGRMERMGNAYTKGRTPCRVCGRPVRLERWWIHEVGGGDQMVRADFEPVNAGAGDLGRQPVGPECRRMIPPAYISESSTVRNLRAE